MKLNKFKINITIFALFAILILALFQSNIMSKPVLAIVLVAYAITVKFVFRKRKTISVYSKQVLFLNIGFAIIYLALFYLSGLYFGYYDSTVKFSIFGICKFILPLTAIIVASEYIRFVFLSQKGKINSIIAFLSVFLIDIVLYIGIYDIKKLDDFLAILGFIVFASLSSNLLFNYQSVRYGYKPIIAYRLITTLFYYIIPITPDVMVFFKSIGRIIYPYIIYLVLEYTYSKNTSAVYYKDRKPRLIATVVVATVAITLAMLISCKFTYGVLVIGSSSMTGTINKGDVILYKSYKDEKIQDKDVIIFNKDNKQLVHRVVKSEVVNNEYRYYTKGDANLSIDDWVVTNSDVVGLYKLKIKYIGYPTLWVNDLFSK